MSDHLRIELFGRPITGWKAHILLILLIVSLVDLGQRVAQQPVVSSVFRSVTQDRIHKAASRHNYEVLLGNYKDPSFQRGFCEAILLTKLHDTKGKTFREDLFDGETLHVGLTASDALDIPCADFIPEFIGGEP